MADPVPTNQLPAKTYHVSAESVSLVTDQAIPLSRHIQDVTLVWDSTQMFLKLVVDYAEDFIVCINGTADSAPVTNRYRDGIGDPKKTEFYLTKDFSAPDFASTPDIKTHCGAVSLTFRCLAPAVDNSFVTTLAKILVEYDLEWDANWSLQPSSYFRVSSFLYPLGDDTNPQPRGDS